MIDLRFTIEEGQKILRKYGSETNYETLVSKLDRDERVSLQRLLQICFTDVAERRTDIDIGFRNQPDGYDDLIDFLSLASGEWAVVSLNYDILFEEALRRKNLAIVYPEFPFEWNRDQTNDPGIRIFKPHGSINFFAHAHHIIYHREPTANDPRGLPTTYNFEPDGNHSPTYPIVFAGMTGADNVLTRADSSDVCQPVMANYTRGKHSDSNQETLKKVRTQALNLARAAEEIVIIGVKPMQAAADDLFVTELLSFKIPKMTYVSGGADGEMDGMIIKSVHRHARICTEGLRDYLGT